MPSYDVLSGVNYKDSWLSYDAGYLVVNGVSTRPQQREQELKRRSSVESPDFDFD